MYTLTKQKLDELENLVEHLSTLYDDGEDCLDFDGTKVSDNEFDEIVAFVQKHRPKSRIFEDVTASNYTSNKDAGLIAHDPPLTSIAKAPSQTRQEELDKWTKNCEEEIEEVTFGQAYKLDGVACRIYYKDGVLDKAGLRPRDGVNAEDVTENIKHIKGIPEKLKLPLTLSVTGEVLCYKDDFEAINRKLKAAGEKLRANPRNHASGAIRQFKDPQKTKDGKLHFIGYSIENFIKSHEYYTDEVKRAKWCNQELGVAFVQVRNYRHEDLKKMEDNVPNLPYQVDGIVVSVKNLEDQEQMGRHGNKPTGSPKGKIAWKFKDEVATAKIKDIKWQIGRTSRVTPVAIFDGVQLAGTNVQRCTLNNIGWMEKRGIGIGTEIKLIKSGAIIPKAIGVVSGKVAKVDYPKELKGNPVTRVPGDGDNVALYCEGHEDTKVGKYMHFLTTLGIKGIGDATIEKLLEKDLIVDFPSIFHLDLADFIKAGLSQRQGLLALAALNFIPNPSQIEDDDKLAAKIAKSPQKRQVQAWQLFAALGIEGAGKTAGKALIEEFGSFVKLSWISADHLADVDGIGEKTAVVINQYLKEHRTENEDLTDFFDLLLPKTGPLSGKSFVFSGSFPEGKKFWEKKVENLGGKCSSSVGSKTAYLVAGPGSGSKSDKAKKLDVPIIDTDELEKIL